MHRTRFRLLGLAMLIGGMPMLLAAQPAGTIVCWTDESGQRACGDRVPPRYAKQERKVYDASGRLIETLPRQKTSEEVEAEVRRAAELEERRRRAAEQAAYDRFLLTSFADVGELEASHNSSLQRLDGRLRRARDTLRENRRGVDQLEAQIADVEKAGRTVPAKLSRELAAFEKAVEENRRAVEQLREERDAQRRKFEKEIARYRALKGLPDPPVEAPDDASVENSGTD